MTLSSKSPGGGLDNRPKQAATVGRWWWVALAVVGVIFVASGRNFRDYTRGQVTQPLSGPDGAYTFVAWMTNDRIVFTYSAKSDPGVWEYELGSYSLQSSDWSILPKNSCEGAEGTIGWLERLPSGELGFIAECPLQDGKGNITSTLYAWNSETGTFRELWHYAEPYWHATDFSFSPDMAELIQTRLDSTAYRVDDDDRLTQIYLDYAHVRSPRWSPDGKTIAFGAAPSDDFLQPWDIYLTDNNSQETRKLISGIEFLSFIKWSPLGRWLSFRGKIQGTFGIWIMDTQTLSLARVWADESFYDWSPDGKQMVIVEQIERVEVDGTHSDRPLIIELPPEVAETAP